MALMMVVAMARKLLGGAAGVVGVATDVARHFAWYIAHRIEGRPRER